MLNKHLVGGLVMALALAPVARAQDLDVRSATHVRDAYMSNLDTLHAKFVALANAIPEGKYSWRPSPGVRSISEVFMHVASEYYFYVPMSVAGPPPADFGPPKEAMAKLEKMTSKAEVLAQLEKSWAHTKVQMAASDPAKMTTKFGRFNMTIDDAAFDMTGDLHEHLGQLIAYARSVGVKPPWSK